MNRFLKTLVISTVVLCFESVAAPAEEEWKCYVQLESGIRHIAHYALVPSQVSSIQEQLRKLPVYASDGRTQLEVKKYIECKPKLTPFSKKQARKLEEERPM